MTSEVPRINYLPQPMIDKVCPVRGELPFVRPIFNMMSVMQAQSNFKVA